MTFEDYFVQRNPKRTFLVDFMKEALGVTTIDFKDITTLNMRVFKDYVMGRVCNNSARNYFAVMKATIRELLADGLISNENILTTLKAKATPSENVYCTEEEIERMDAYYDRLMNMSGRQAEKDCLCLFLLENVTGARTSDCEKMTLDNIVDGKLTYISQKTKQKSVMPVHSKLLKYLRHRPTKSYSCKTKSTILKRIAKKCGITEEVTLFYRGKYVTGPKYKFISTHTGRRNFATHLALHGAPITEICQFMNHRQNITQTMRYIIPDFNKVSDEARTFFA